MSRYLENAFRLAPGHYNLRRQYALDLFRRGEYLAAAAHADTLAAIVPEIAESRVLRLISLIEGGASDKAVEEGRVFVDRFPDDHGIPHQLSRALAREGRFEEAERQRLEAMARTPTPAPAGQWVHLGALRLMQGDTAGAAVALDSARARARADSVASPPTLEALNRTLAEGDTATIPFW